MITALEEADRQVSELLLAWRVCCPDGSKLSGEHLLRWRALGADERRYFAALLAPQRLPHTADRIVADGQGGWRHDPPPQIPNPCSCWCTVIIEHLICTVRCCRCLHVWGNRQEHAASRAELRGSPTLADALPQLNPFIPFALSTLPPQPTQTRAAERSAMLDAGLRESFTPRLLSPPGKEFTWVSATDEQPIRITVQDRPRKTFEPGLKIDKVGAQSEQSFPSGESRAARVIRQRSQLLAELSRPFPKAGP